MRIIAIILLLRDSTVHGPDAGALATQVQTTLLQPDDHAAAVPLAGAEHTAATAFAA
jgi:hypothetical protein